VSTRLQPAIAKKGERKYNLVLLGATGFTGQLALEHLARNYSGDDVKWAIAGRNPKKLEAVVEKVKQLVPAWEG